jgi:hypothetical protein
MTEFPTMPCSLDEVALPQTLPSVLPPVVIVAFTRPELLQQVLDAIAVQTLLPPRILAFLDGPRKPADEVLIQECVAVLQAFSKIVPVEIVARPNNLGCDRNVLTTLTEVAQEYPSLVYLEDDVVPNPDFYDRLCRLLEAYKPHHQVFSVSAYASFPAALRPDLDRDFLVSKRVFALGLGLWSDRWLDLDLLNKPVGYNPFGSFSNIPATIQTQYTITNQFFVEKNKKTDWVITMTLAALQKGYVHIIPTVSFVRNIGFGHAEAKTYRGAEPDWANANFKAEARPNTLPATLDLPKLLAEPLPGKKLAAHLQACDGLWLNPLAFWNLVMQSRDWQDISSFLKLFLSRGRIFLGRWRSGLPV